jgi:heme exporter protein C
MRKITSFIRSIAGNYLLTSILIVCFIAILFCNWLIFMVVPDEAVMGAVQRIFYFHVGSAIACYVAFTLVAVFSIAYLAYEDIEYDICNQAATEVGFLFCTITLVSGMIWAKTAWNTWFRWEPRLVNFLLLWCLAASLIFMRRFGSRNQVRNHAAVMGLLTSLTIPLIWVSIKLAPAIGQLHPEVVEKGGLKDPSYILCFIVSVLTLILFQLILVILRARIGFLEYDIIVKHDLKK